MNRIEQLREQIDACRPGSDDLALPELAELARAAEEDRAVAAEVDRAQRFDRAVSAALLDAPVPAGMLDRILAAAEAARPAPRARRFSRRWAIALAAVAAIAVGAVTLALNWPKPTQTVSKEDLAGLAVDWYDDTAGLKGWTPIKSPPPAAYKFDPAVLSPPVAWRTYSTASGPAVVYDCTAPLGQPVFLFVVNSPAKFSVDTLPYSELPGASKGMRIGAWQKDNLLYVLVVVEDGQQRLDRLIRKPSVT